MLDILLSHWAVYFYAAYLVVLVVLCIVYRPQPKTRPDNLRSFRLRMTRRMPSMRSRPFH